MRALINKCTSFICSFVLLIGFIIQPFGMRVANAAAPQTVSKSIYLRTTVGQENEVGKFDLWELIPPSMRYKDGLKIHRITIKGSQNSYATLGHGGGDGYMIGIWSYSKLSFNGQTENLVFTSTGGSKGDWNSGNVPSKEQVNEEYRDITLDGKSEFQLFLSGEKISFYPDTASSTLDVKVEIEFTPPNLSPILEVEQYDRVGSYFVHLDGKVSDPDQDELNIEVDFAGHPFGMTIHPGESNWFMSLPVDRVPEGVYSNIPVTANDHKSPPVTVMYKGKITIDRTPPTAPKIILSTDKWSSQPIKVNIIPGVDALSGVARTEYKLSGNATQNWSRNDGEDIVIQSEGVIHIAARTIDRAGNISNEVTSSVYVDKSQPTSPVFTANHNGWSNNNVTVSLEDGKSSFSPLKQSEYSIDGQPWQIYQLPIEIKKEGITRISGRTINQVGHVSPESSITVNIDRTPPTSPKLQPSITGWTNQDVLVSLKHGDDALSGIRNSEFNIDGQGWVNYSSPIQITKEGSTRVSARTIDQAGNIGPVTEITVSIDKSAPAISINPINRTWDSTDIPAEIRYSDSLSGVDPNSRKYAVTNSPVPPANWNTATADVQHITITNEGEWYVHAAVADKAGNIKNVSSQSLQLQSIPQEPANFRVTSVEGETVHLAWDLPAGNVLADGYEYNIGNLTTGRSWTVAYPGHTLQDQNVEAGKTYEYRITVKNHVGSSAYTVPVSALTLPAAVKGLSVSPIGREAFAGSVKFESSLSADQYHIAVRENDTKQLVYESTVTDATYQPIQNLKPGVNYTVTVTAENGSGRGAAASVGFLSLPDAPGQFSAIQINTDGIYLGWTSVTSATYYDLERDQSFIYGGADLFYKDTGLQSGTEYNYGVSAKNDTGYGMKSELANVITLPARTSVTATTYGTDRITLQWPSVKGAANYVVGVDGQEVGTVTAATYGTLQTYEITGLNPGVSYRFSLQPENSSGSGEETYVVAFTLPEAVTEGSVEVTDITETTAVMKWDAVPGATTYRVRIGESLYELSDTVLNLNGLQEGTSYQSIIEAGNGSGYGPGTTISFLTLPPQVGEIAAYEQGSELQLSWKPVPSAKEYIVEKNGQIVGTVSESAWKAKDLSAGESYHFSVRAVNETGEGSKTPFIWRMLPDGMEDLKVRVSDISEHSAKLSWEAAAGADGYRVYQGKKQLLQVTETNSVLDGLASGLTYKDLKIVPFNSTGETKGAKVPAFATLPSELFKVNVEAAENKLTYHFEIDSENETIVVVRDGKEVYRDKDREFVLRPLPSGVEIKVEVWAENEFGQRSKGQVIKAKTLNSSQDSNGTSSSSNGSDNSFAKDLNKKQEDLEIVNDDKSKNESAESNKDNGDIFIDIDELYNKDSILSLYERGVVKANPYKVFEPNRSVTRAEYMAMIVRALELEGKEAPPMLFRDIDKEAWYYRELQIAHSNGIINGFNIREFRPNAIISREQAAKMLGNALKKKQSTKLSYTDQKRIADWAKKEVEALTASTIIQGYPDGTFRPKETVIRAEGAEFIYKFLGVAQEWR